MNTQANRTFLSIIFVIIISFISISSFASSKRYLRDWHKVTIPDAKCGNGDPYSIWIDFSDTKKLAIEFMGGGACWSNGTCFGPSWRTWLFPIPRFPLMSIFSMTKKSISPVYDHTYIYFPYCTGDVHTGFHTASYQPGKKVFHHGHTNAIKAITFLKHKRILLFENFNELVMFGASAGAIGAFVHAPFIASIISPQAKKVLIADSPGMHFGKNFWQKFTPKLRSNFKENFARLQLHYDDENGNIAPYMGKVCDYFNDWNIGILQGSKDIVMSKLFGDISANQHETLVYGKNGIWESTSQSPNCSVWLPQTMQHTFLLFPTSFKMKSSGKKAIDFAKDIIKGKQNINYRY